MFFPREIDNEAFSFIYSLGVSIVILFFLRFGVELLLRCWGF